MVMLAEHTLDHFEQAPGVDVAQRREIRWLIGVEGARQFDTALLLRLERADTRPTEITTALDDRTMHQSMRSRGQHQGRDVSAPCRFAEQRDTTPIAAEGRDMPLHPAQRGQLVP